MCLFASAEIWVLLRTTNWREIVGLCALSGMEGPEKIIKIITSLSLNRFTSLTRRTVLKFHQKKHSDITISLFEPEMKNKKSTYALSEWRLKHVFAESTTCSLWSRAALRCGEGWWTRSCFPHKADLRGRLVHWQNRVMASSWMKIYEFRSIFHWMLFIRCQLVQIMAWRRPGDKSFFEQVMVSLQTHICVIPPQGVLNGLLSSLRKDSHLPRERNSNIHVITTTRSDTTTICSCFTK